MKMKNLGWLVSVWFLALTATGAQADVIVAANAASFGGGPIGTFNFTTGLPVGSFVPTGAFGTNNGRGLAMTVDRFFYTELTGGFGSTDSIRIAPYNGGAGGADIGSFANPVPGKGIQALAFGAAGLYVLTGYPDSPPTVWILNGVTGAIVGGPVALAGGDSAMDGFTVLPDGSFIGNLGDAANSYTHWSAAGVQSGPAFSVPGCGGTATGVDIAPDGLSLYFMCGFSSFIHTDLTGTVFLGSISALGSWEDIAIQQPFSCEGSGCTPVPAPATLIILGVGALGLAALGRIRSRRA